LLFAIFNWELVKIWLLLKWSQHDPLTLTSSRPPEWAFTPLWCVENDFPSGLANDGLRNTLHHDYIRRDTSLQKVRRDTLPVELVLFNQTWVELSTHKLVNVSWYLKWSTLIKNHSYSQFQKLLLIHSSIQHLICRLQIICFLFKSGARCNFNTKTTTRILNCGTIIALINRYKWLVVILVLWVTPKTPWSLHLLQTLKPIQSSTQYKLNFIPLHQFNTRIKNRISNISFTPSINEGVLTL
jgi:hypothetical protein